MCVGHGRSLGVEGRARHGELGGELLHLRPQRCQLGNVGLVNILLEAGQLLAVLALAVDLHCDINCSGQVLAHALEVLLHQPTGGQGGASETKAAGDERLGVARYRVLVGGDVRLLKHFLHTCTIDALGAQVNQEKMVVGPARDKPEAMGGEGLAKHARILDGLLLVCHEGWVHRLMQGHRQGRNRMVVGATLERWENCEVDLLLQLVVHGLAVPAHLLALAIENHATARAPQRLVRGAGHHVGVLKRVGVGDPRGNQATDVSHVGEQECAHRVANLAHFLVVYVARVRTEAGNDQLGPEELGIVCQRGVVDELRLRMQAIRHGLKENGGRRNPLLVRHVAMGQVATMGKVKAHDPVVWVQQRGVRRKVGR
mmetsp:Transcript_50566/g.127007  ORF Transcript_50566/g.127007 Transcript_50566/m.127007 type:complete len:371 (-) Transcript_50566:413-1525(-)